MGHLYDPRNVLGLGMNRMYNLEKRYNVSSPQVLLGACVVGHYPSYPACTTRRQASLGDFFHSSSKAILYMLLTSSPPPPIPLAKDAGT